MFGQILGAVAGGLFANKRAKEDRAAMDRANDARMAGFNLYKPYLESTLEGSQGALNDVLGQGAYTGQTFAGPNADQLAIAQQGLNNAALTGGYGAQLMNTGVGFGNNANQLYNAALNNAGNVANYQGVFNRNIADQRGVAGNLGNVANQFGSIYGNIANTDRMGRANQFAMDNAGGVVDNILRDDRRALGQAQLGSRMAATGTGNTNSSKAAVADAILQRGFQDRRADVMSDVTNQLRNQSLAEQSNQFNQMNTALGNTQNALLAQGGAYDNTARAAQGAVGNIGAGQGILSNAASANTQLQSAFNTGSDAMRQGYGLGMQAGGFGQAQAQAALDDARANYERQRDFELQQYQNYMAGMLGRAPNSSQNVEANMVNPASAALGGAMSGFGMMGGQLPFRFGGFA